MSHLGPMFLTGSSFGPHPLRGATGHPGLLAGYSCTGSVGPASVSAHIGSLGGYGSRGFYSVSGSLGTVADQSRPNAVYHYENLEPQHLKREERVDLYNKLVELLAAEDGEK